MYYQYEEPVKKAAGHRILALNRGEKEKFLTVKVEAPEEEILRYLEKKILVRDNPIHDSGTKGGHRGQLYETDRPGSGAGNPE